MTRSLLTCCLPHPLAVLLGMTVVTVATAGCQSSTPAAPGRAPSPDTWAMVDGREITREDVEKAYRRVGPAADGLSDEEELTAKLTLLNELIVQDILIAKAGELKIELPDSELEAAFQEAKQNIPDEAFQQELSRRNLTVADMREGLRRELLAQKVIDQEVTSKISVTDREITDFFEANRAQFNLAEDAYRVAQIAITPVRDEQITNRTGDDATTVEAARNKAQMLMEKLKAGVSFPDLAMDYSEDPDTAPRGGDLGFIPVSRLKQAPPPLRDAVLKATPGTANLVSQDGAHTIVLVLAHEKAGQRDLSMPGVRENITATLRGRKEQLLRAAYLTAIRTEADVVNYLARRVIEGQGTIPNLGPTAPGGR